VAERTDYGGNILHPVDEQEVATQARQLLDKGVEAVVVSFLHSYANPANEQRARQVLEQIWPNPYIVIASEVLPEFREFERTSTAVVNAYVQPSSIATCAARPAVRQKGYERTLLIQSNGGVMSSTCRDGFR
jgi:N-methylhydantoinase A